jgi:hypothetical protein
MKRKIHIRTVNLFFRKAWQDWNKTQSAEHSFEKWLRELKKKLGDSFTIEDQWYWDILWAVNQRGKSLPELAEETIDPEKEAWIKQEINDPEGIFRKKKVMVYGK